MRQALFEAALKARENAYAPHSRYKVGAAAIDVEGTIFAGCNVENDVFPLGQCAERVAIQSMVASGSTTLTALLVLTEDGATPCGACRQVIAQFAPRNATVYMATPAGVVTETTISDLLPDAFSLER